MNPNPESRKLTFLELIKEYKIEIPIIQRDYAQGREEKSELRDDFLNTLSSIVDNKKVELDFVYGSVKNGVFQPLDGQQRLTTLFLMHWFIALKENKLDEFKNLLIKFTYETRVSSREFCYELINKGIIYNKDKSVSQQIKDSSWFFHSWERDPTIKSMLTMLDSIEKKFKEYEIEVWEKLNNISFYYIELQNFGLSDDLYIKMNARGKPLTDFENFKAKFEQFIRKNNWETDIELAETFSYQIDTKWADLFWHFRNEKNVFDDQISNFFRTMAIINYAIKANEKEDFRRCFASIKDKEKISFKEYLDLECFDEDYFNTLKSVLNKLSGREGLKKFTSDKSNIYINEQEIFQGAIDNKLGYAELLKLYAFYKYLVDKENIDAENLENWLRIVRNIVEAHRLYYDNANIFADSLLFINAIFSRVNDILEYFKENINPQTKGFPKLIIEEEKLKARLIVQSNDWKQAIIEIENHSYFNGQIGFLLDWCKDEKGKLNIDKFREYVAKAKVIFEPKGLSKQFDNNLFERALLATGDYLLKKGSNLSFLVDNDRDISWKRLLRDNNEKRSILKELFDKVEIDTLEDDLKRIVDEFVDKDDWRYYFIKYPEIISACGKNRFIRYNNEKDILLLGSTKVYGYHKEYYTYSLYVELENRYKNKISYKDQKSIESSKYFEIDGKQITFDGNSYIYTENSDWEKGFRFSKREEIIEIIEKNIEK